MKTVDNFILTKVIGRDDISVTYLCEIKNYDKIEPETKKRMRAGRKIAWKMINQKNINVEMMKNLAQEIEVMMSITHDNIIRFLEAKKTTNNIYIFFEYWNGGNLRDFIVNFSWNIDEEFCKILLNQIIEGLNHLNKNRVIYTDLNSSFILLNFPNYEKEGEVSFDYLETFDHTKDKIEIVIGDLNFVRSSKDELLNIIHESSNKISKEFKNEISFDLNEDIRSIGSIMYEILIENCSKSDFDINNLNDNFLLLYRSCTNTDFTVNYINLLDSWLLLNKQNQTNFYDILNHPFMNEKNVFNSEYYEDKYNSFKVGWKGLTSFSEESLNKPLNKYILNNLHITALKISISNLNQAKEKRNKKIKEEHWLNFILLNKSEELKQNDENIKDNINLKYSDDKFSIDEMNINLITQINEEEIKNQESSSYLQSNLNYKLKERKQAEINTDIKQINSSASEDIINTSLEENKDNILVNSESNNDVDSSSFNSSKLVRNLTENVKSQWQVDSCEEAKLLKDFVIICNENESPCENSEDFILKVCSDTEDDTKSKNNGSKSNQFVNQIDEIEQLNSSFELINFEDV